MATTQPAAKARDPGSGRRLPGPSPLIVLGGGDHARVVIDAARSRPGRWSVVGFAAPGPAPTQAATYALLDVPYLGDDAALRTRLEADDGDDRPSLILGFGGIGDLATRAATADDFDQDVRWARIVHATAWTSPSAVIGDGTVVLAGAVVNAGANIGRHVIVNSGAIVEHDVTIGDGSHVAPGAVIGGGARIGRFVFVGLGARIRDHIEIGDGAVIGMGAAVLDDIVAGATVVGIPARQLGDERG